MKLIIPTGRKISTFDTQVNGCSCNCACSIVNGESAYVSTLSGGSTNNSVAQYPRCTCQCSYGSANQSANSTMANY